MKPGAYLVTYGPYRVNGELTPESNIRFDQNLKTRNPEWGIREINDCKKLASENNLTFIKKVSMPANNFAVIYQKNACN